MEWRARFISGFSVDMTISRSFFVSLRDPVINLFLHSAPKLMTPQFLLHFVD